MMCLSPPLVASFTPACHKFVHSHNTYSTGSCLCECLPAVLSRCQSRACNMFSCWCVLFVYLVSEYAMRVRQQQLLA